MVKVFLKARIFQNNYILLKIDYCEMIPYAYNNRTIIKSDIDNCVIDQGCNQTEILVEVISGKKHLFDIL